MNDRAKNAVLLGTALLFLLVCFFLSLRLGSTYLSGKELFRALLARTGYERARVILLSIRLPRALGAVFAGFGFALSGTLLQHVTDNPLAAPHVLGINAGAGFFVMLCLTVAPAAYALLPFAAFFGAMLTAIAILVLAERAVMSKSTILLCGVAFSALFGAGISFFSVLDADALVSYTDFSIGGLRGLTLQDLYFPIPILFACLIGALLLSRPLHLFCLGDSLAASLGVRVRRVRLLALICAAASAAAAVSFAGLLGFVGLLVPHISRKLAHGNTQTEVLLSPMLGGILLLLADLAGRVLFSPGEIPVGIFTALLGVPFFLSLLLRRKQHA